MAPYSESHAPTKRFLHINNDAYFPTLHMLGHRAAPTSTDAMLAFPDTQTPETSTPTAATQSHTIPLKARGATSTPGGGSINPSHIHSQGFLALFALLGAALVIGAIWFFFWARNGGFHWRGRSDWEDYKSTVLRRKDEFGRPLSTATPSTRLGQESVLFPPSTVAPGNPKGSKVNQRYVDDVDDDDGGNGGVNRVHGERSGSREEHAGNNAGEYDNMMTEMRDLMAKPKEKKKSGLAARLFRRKKDDQRAPERPRDEEEIPVLEPPSNIYPPGVESNVHDADIRAYRNEQPAAIGGINAPVERMRSEHSGPPAQPAPKRNVSGYSFIPGEEDVVSMVPPPPPQPRYDYEEESGGRRASRRDGSRRQSQTYVPYYHDNDVYDNDYTDPFPSSPDRSSHARRRRERQLERERSLVANEDASDPFSSPFEDRRQSSRRHSGHQPDAHSRSRRTRDSERSRARRSSRSYAPRNSYTDYSTPEAQTPDVDLDREYRNAMGMSKGYRRSGTGYHDRYDHYYQNNIGSSNSRNNEAPGRNKTSRRRRDSLSDSEAEDSRIAY